MLAFFTTVRFQKREFVTEIALYFLMKALGNISSAMLGLGLKAKFGGLGLEKQVLGLACQGLV